MVGPLYPRQPLCQGVLDEGPQAFRPFFNKGFQHLAQDELQYYRLEAKVRGDFDDILFAAVYCKRERTCRLVTHQER